MVLHVRIQLAFICAAYEVLTDIIYAVWHSSYAIYIPHLERAQIACQTMTEETARQYIESLKEHMRDIREVCYNSYACNLSADVLWSSRSMN